MGGSLTLPGNRLGTVELGKLADLIVLGGNSVKDLGLLEVRQRAVRFVLWDGRIMRHLTD